MAGSHLDEIFMAPGRNFLAIDLQGDRLIVAWRSRLLHRRQGRMPVAF
jgi:hypothetical protein